MPCPAAGAEGKSVRGVWRGRGPAPTLLALFSFCTSMNNTKVTIYHLEARLAGIDVIYLDLEREISTAILSTC